MSTDTAVKVKPAKKGGSKKGEPVVAVIAEDGGQTRTTAQKVVELKGQGMKPGQIATALGISPSSVSQHLRKAGLSRAYTANKSVLKVVASLSDETRASMRADLVKQKEELEATMEQTKAAQILLKGQAKTLGRQIQSDGAKLRSITARIAAL